MKKSELAVIFFGFLMFIKCLRSKQKKLGKLLLICIYIYIYNDFAGSRDLCRRGSAFICIGIGICVLHKRTHTHTHTGKAEERGAKHSDRAKG